MINIKNFENIRLIAILSILVTHTALLNLGIAKNLVNITEKSTEIYYYQLLTHTLYINIFKAGTIIFFIISGFLFEMQVVKFKEFTVFVRKKSKSLLHPYFIIFMIPTLIFVGIIEPNFGIKENLSFYLFAIKSIENIFLTNYWFVPALFITLIINYFIKTKYLIKSLIVFVSVWLISYINLYLKFTITSHTVWFCGFFFIFTLGRLMNVYNNQIANVNLFRSKNKLLLITFICYIVSNLESMIILVYGHNIDNLSTLRIGNIAYSFFLFYLLNVIFNKIKFVLPIEISFYFIYLIHPFVLRITNFILYKNNLIVFDYPFQLLYDIIHFLIVLIFCVAIQQIFFKLKFKSKFISEYVFK
ncbi:acyltransferase family protein [Flavobacterium sp. 83]|uniref:acyltransferase family protein n=1 Tax=Flavobacterium sp. 83 TaxID=1131812 RepID=UPI0005583B94|nr:acyltransferase family protein [Flavobacterium sp. 83]